MNLCLLLLIYTPILTGYLKERAESLDKYGSRITKLQWARDIVAKEAGSPVMAPITLYTMHSEL